MTASLTLRALLEFVWLDIVALGGFRALRGRVRRVAVSSSPHSQGDVQRVSASIRRACMLYFKRVNCLQRSAAATCMLRRRGFPAELVIGFKPLPISSHAWVELEGQVVSDGTPQQEHYLVLDRW